MLCIKSRVSAVRSVCESNDLSTDYSVQIGGGQLQDGMRGTTSALRASSFHGW